MIVPVTVVILTHNEELNLARAVDSVRNWAESIVVIDANSTDRTVTLAQEMGCDVVKHAFEDYGRQRNFALDYLADSQPSWVLFLDADERVSEELRTEILKRMERDPSINGFYVRRRFIWMGRWIRWGYYQAWILRLFRYGKGRCEERSVNEHIVVAGKVDYLKKDLLHENHKGIDAWIEKHNRYATLEANELLQRTGPESGQLSMRLTGSQAERKRWLRERLWNRLPPLLRPMLYFFYRYVLRGGFLDGAAGFSYHALQAFWYPLLVDLKYLELKRKVANRNSPLD